MGLIHARIADLGRDASHCVRSPAALARVDQNNRADRQPHVRCPDRNEPPASRDAANVDQRARPHDRVLVDVVRAAAVGMHGPKAHGVGKTLVDVLPAGIGHAAVVE